MQKQHVFVTSVIFIHHLRMTLTLTISTIIHCDSNSTAKAAAIYKSPPPIPPKISILDD
jgi:hypothetical protein